jgi:hypothetical protein
MITSQEPPDSDATAALSLVTLFEREAAATRCHLVLNHALSSLGPEFSCTKSAYSFLEIASDPSRIATKIKTADIVAIAADADTPLSDQLTRFLNESLAGRSAPTALVAVCLEAPDSHRHEEALECSVRAIAGRHRMRMIVTHAPFRPSNEANHADSASLISH